MAHKGVDGQTQHTDVDHRAGQALKDRGNGLTAQTAAALPDDVDSKDIAQPAAKGKGDALQDRIVLVGTDAWCPARRCCRWPD